MFHKDRNKQACIFTVLFGRKGFAVLKASEAFDASNFFKSAPMCNANIQSEISKHTQEQLAQP